MYINEEDQNVILVDLSDYRLIKQSNNRIIKLSISQPTKKTINRLMKQSIKLLYTPLINQTTIVICDNIID